MSCSICHRSSCTRSFHSIEEQERFDARQEMSDDVDSLREEVQELQERVSELEDEIENKGEIT